MAEIEHSVCQTCGRIDVPHTHSHVGPPGDNRVCHGPVLTEMFVPESQLQGAVDRVSVLEQALLIACENDEGGAARFVRMAQAALADAVGGR